jgi:hypothetical protein
MPLLVMLFGDLERVQNRLQPVGWPMPFTPIPKPKCHTLSTATMKPDDSQALRNFLKMLDESDMTVSDWEAGFIESNLSREHFSPKQREITVKLIEKYGQRIGYL